MPRHILPVRSVSPSCRLVQHSSRLSHLVRGRAKLPPNFGSRSPRQGRMREKFESLRSPPGTACLVCRASQYACIAVTAHPPYHQAAIWVHDVRLSAVRARAVARHADWRCLVRGARSSDLAEACCCSQGAWPQRASERPLIAADGSFVERTADLAMNGQQCDVGAASARLNSGAETARLWCEDRPARLRTAAASRGVCVASFPTRAASAARLVVWSGQTRARSFTTRRLLLLARRWCDDCSAQFWCEDRSIVVRRPPSPTVYDGGFSWRLRR